MSNGLLAVWLGLAGPAACGSSGGGSPRARAAEDAGAAPRSGGDPAPLVAVPLGMADLTGFAYSRGPARKTFKLAVAAEERGDWAAAERQARAALAIDPGYLEAHWLLARALARLGRNDEVGPPLVAAVAGDWLRWGKRSLEDPDFAAFRAGAQGAQFRALVDRYGQQMRDVARDGLWLVGRRGKAWRPRSPGDTRINHRTEIYAYDFAGERYVRLSRTNGSAVGFVRSPAGNAVAYVSYHEVWLPTDEQRAAGRVPVLRELRIGTVDADGPRMSEREVVFENAWAVELWYATSLGARAGDVSAASPALIARVWEAGEGGAPERKPTTYRLDPGRGRAAALAAPEPRSDVLRVTYEGVALRRPRVEGVAADWDRNGVAGAFMLTDTSKTITLPEGQSASRHTMRWSARRLRLAFATQPVDPCSAERADRSASLYVVDAATGRLREIARGAHDFAPVWLDDARLAYVAQPEDGSPPGLRVYDAEAGREAAALDAVGGAGTQWLPSGPVCSGAALVDPAGAGDDDGSDEWDDEWPDDDGLAPAATAPRSPAPTR